MFLDCKLKLLVNCNKYLVFIVVFVPSTKTCSPEDSPICGQWSIIGTVVFDSLQRPIFGLAVCWMLFACITSNGGRILCIMINE